MAEVVAHMSMSLDGFIAAPDDTVPHIFDWYENGPVEVRTASEHVFHVSEASAPVVGEALQMGGCLLVGRRLFDVTHGWGGTHPAGCPIVVLTHEPPDDWADDGRPFRFVTTGIEDATALAKEIAGDKAVGTSGASISQQLLQAGLLDVIEVNLVPVLLGEGIRWFDHLGSHAILLDDPEVVEGDRVTHLRYRVRKD